MVGWYHRLDGHEFEQASGVADGQGSLVCHISGLTMSWTQLSDSTKLKSFVVSKYYGIILLKLSFKCIIAM